MIVLLVLLSSCTFVDIEIPLPAAPVQPSAGAQSFSVTAAWFSDVSLFLDPWGGWPLCHHSAGHRETTEQVFFEGVDVPFGLYNSIL